MGLIFGRLSGSDIHYLRYSAPLLESEYLWNSTNLRRWLTDPQRVVKGTKCGMKPIEEDSVACDLVQFLKEFTLVNYNNLRGMVAFLSKSRKTLLLFYGTMTLVGRSGR